MRNVHRLNNTEVTYLPLPSLNHGTKKTGVVEIRGEQWHVTWQSLQ